MRFQHRTFQLACCALLFAACTKEDVEQAPNVTIVVPQDGFSVGIPDTLWVTADVNGNPRVDKVSFSLTDENGVPAAETITIKPSSDPARLIIGLPVLSEHAISGTYKLTVRAFYGDAQGSDYRSIHVTATALRLRAIYAFTVPSPGTVGLFRIDSTGTLSQVNTFVSDFAGAAISSYGQTLAFAGRVNGPVTALAPDGSHVKWQLPNQSVGGIPWFTGMDATQENVIHVGTSNGQLRGYNATNGSSGVIASMTTGYQAKRSIVAGEKLIAAEESTDGSQLKVLICQAASGAFITEQFLDKRIIAMHARNADNVLLFGNRNGQGVVEDRNISGGGGWEPYTWPAPITAVSPTNENGVFLVALESGAVERFNYENATSFTLLSGASIPSMALDAVNGTVVAGRGSDIVALDPFSGSIIGTWSLGQPVAQVLVLLNR